MARAFIPADGTLICERCGYEIEGLAPESVCPECGLEVAMSLPIARRGSPWQRDPGVVMLLATWAGLIRHPIRTFDEVRVDPDDGALLWTHAAVSGIALTGVWPIIQHGLLTPGKPMIDFLLLAPMAVLLVRLLIAIEQWGTVFFGRRKGWRITGPIARAICAHAAVGWVVAGVLALLGWVVGTVLEASLRTAALGPLRPIIILGPQWMPVAGILAGMIVFETLSYIGMRRMRFVNAGGTRRRGGNAEAAESRPGSG